MEDNKRAQLQRAISTHVQGDGAKILAGQNNEGSLRAADHSAFQKFKAVAKKIIVTKEVLELLHGASANLRAAQKEFEAGTLLPSQNPPQPVAAAAAPAEQANSRPHTAAVRWADEKPSSKTNAGSGAVLERTASNGSCMHKQSSKNKTQSAKSDWGFFRMMDSLREAPAAVVARLSPEGAPRPEQPGLSADPATRQSWDAWELLAEQQAVKASTGWRDLLAQNKAKIKDKNAERDIQEAAARLIQAAWRLYRQLLITQATQELDDRIGRGVSPTSSTSHSSSFSSFAYNYARHRRSTSVSPVRSRSVSPSRTHSTRVKFDMESVEGDPKKHAATVPADDTKAEPYLVAAPLSETDWAVAMAEAAAASAAAAAASAAAAAVAAPRETSPVRSAHRKNVVVTYEPKGRQKAAARPQPMSVAVGRDGLAINTAMPASSKWKKGITAAMAANGFMQAMDKLGNTSTTPSTNTSRRTSADGMTADGDARRSHATSRNVSVTGASATEAAAAAHALATSRSMQRGECAGHMSNSTSRRTSAELDDSDHMQSHVKSKSVSVAGALAADQIPGSGAYAADPNSSILGPYHTSRRSSTDVTIEAEASQQCADGKAAGVLNIAAAAAAAAAQTCPWPETSSKAESAPAAVVNAESSSAAPPTSSLVTAMEVISALAAGQEAAVASKRAADPAAAAAAAVSTAALGAGSTTPSCILLSTGFEASCVSRSSEHGQSGSASSMVHKSPAPVAGVAALTADSAVGPGQNAATAEQHVAQLAVLHTQALLHQASHQHTPQLLAENAHLLSGAQQHQHPNSLQHNVLTLEDIAPLGGAVQAQGSVCSQSGGSVCAPLRMESRQQDADTNVEHRLQQPASSTKQQCSPAAAGKSVLYSVAGATDAAVVPACATSSLHAGAQSLCSADSTCEPHVKTSRSYQQQDAASACTLTSSAAVDGDESACIAVQQAPAVGVDVDSLQQQQHTCVKSCTLSSMSAASLATHQSITGQQGQLEQPQHQDVQPLSAGSVATSNHGAGCSGLHEFGLMHQQALQHCVPCSSTDGTTVSAIEQNAVGFAAATDLQPQQEQQQQQTMQPCFHQETASREVQHEPVTQQQAADSVIARKLKLQLQLQNTHPSLLMTVIGSVVQTSGELGNKQAAKENSVDSPHIQCQHQPDVQPSMASNQHSTAMTQHANELQEDVRTCDTSMQVNSLQQQGAQASTPSALSDAVDWPVAASSGGTSSALLQGLALNNRNGPCSVQGAVTAADDSVDDAGSLQDPQNSMQAASSYSRFTTASSDDADIGTEQQECDSGSVLVASNLGCTSSPAGQMQLGDVQVEAMCSSFHSCNEGEDQDEPLVLSAAAEAPSCAAVDTTTSAMASPDLHGTCPVAPPVTAGEAVLSFCGGAVAVAPNGDSSGPQPDGSAASCLYRGSSLDLTGGCLRAGLASPSMSELHQEGVAAALWPTYGSSTATSNNKVSTERCEKESSHSRQLQCFEGHSEQSEQQRAVLVQHQPEEQQLQQQLSRDEAVAPELLASQEQQHQSPQLSPDTQPQLVINSQDTSSPSQRQSPGQQLLPDKEQLYFGVQPSSAAVTATWAHSLKQQCHSPMSDVSMQPGTALSQNEALQMQQQCCGFKPQAALQVLLLAKQASVQGSEAGVQSPGDGAFRNATRTSALSSPESTAVMAESVSPPVVQEAHNSSAGGSAHGPLLHPTPPKQESSAGVRSPRDGHRVHSAKAATMMLSNANAKPVVVVANSSVAGSNRSSTSSTGCETYAQLMMGNSETTERLVTTVEVMGPVLPSVQDRHSFGSTRASRGSSSSTGYEAVVQPMVCEPQVPDRQAAHVVGMMGAVPPSAMQNRHSTGSSRTTRSSTSSTGYEAADKFMAGEMKVVAPISAVQEKRMSTSTRTTRSSTSSTGSDTPNQWMVEDAKEPISHSSRSTRSTRSSTSTEAEVDCQLMIGEPRAPKGHASRPQIHRPKSPGLKAIVPPLSLPTIGTATIASQNSSLYTSSNAQLAVGEPPNTKASSCAKPQCSNQALIRTKSPGLQAIMPPTALPTVVDESIIKDIAAAAALRWQQHQLLVVGRVSETDAAQAVQADIHMSNSGPVAAAMAAVLAPAAPAGSSAVRSATAFSAAAAAAVGACLVPHVPVKPAGDVAHVNSSPGNSPRAGRGVMVKPARVHHEAQSSGNMAECQSATSGVAGEAILSSTHVQRSQMFEMSKGADTEGHVVADAAAAGASCGIGCNAILPQLAESSLVNCATGDDSTQPEHGTAAGGLKAAAAAALSMPVVAAKATHGLNEVHSACDAAVEAFKPAATAAATPGTVGNYSTQPLAAAAAVVTAYEVAAAASAAGTVSSPAAAPVPVDSTQPSFKSRRNSQHKSSTPSAADAQLSSLEQKLGSAKYLAQNTDAASRLAFQLDGSESGRHRTLDDGEAVHNVSSGERHSSNNAGCLASNSYISCGSSADSRLLGQLPSAATESTPMQATQWASHEAHSTGSALQVEPLAKQWTSSTPAALATATEGCGHSGAEITGSMPIAWNPRKRSDSEPAVPVWDARMLPIRGMRSSDGEGHTQQQGRLAAMHVTPTVSPRYATELSMTAAAATARIPVPRRGPSPLLGAASLPQGQASASAAATPRSSRGPSPLPPQHPCDRIACQAAPVHTRTTAVVGAVNSSATRGLGAELSANSSGAPRQQLQQSVLTSSVDPHLQDKQLKQSVQGNLGFVELLSNSNSAYHNNAFHAGSSKSVSPIGFGPSSMVALAKQGRLASESLLGDSTYEVLSIMKTATSGTSKADVSSSNKVWVANVNARHADTSMHAVTVGKITAGTTANSGRGEGFVNKVRRRSSGSLQGGGKASQQVAEVHEWGNAVLALPALGKQRRNSAVQ